VGVHSLRGEHFVYLVKIKDYNRLMTTSNDMIESLIEDAVQICEDAAKKLETIRGSLSTYRSHMTYKQVCIKTRFESVADSLRGAVFEVTGK